MMKPPQGFGATHVLGTDNLGRDMFSRDHSTAPAFRLLIAFAVVFVSGIDRRHARRDLRLFRRQRSIS